MKKLVVTAVGLHLHDKPTHHSAVTDSLAKGDVLEVIHIHPDKASWVQVRVAHIANARYANAREGAKGWVYTRGTVADVNETPKPAPKPTPKPIPKPEPAPDWIFWGALAIAAALVAWLAVTAF